MLFPHIMWAVIYFLIFEITDLLLDTDWVNGLQNLLLQILTGSTRELCPQMWFQTSLIILTIIFCLLFYFLLEKLAFFVTYLLAIGSVYLQYSGINYRIFGASFMLALIYKV